MRIRIEQLDKFILILLSYVVLVDMFNGFFIMYYTKLPISQVFKFVLLSLFFFRLSYTRDFAFALLIVLLFLIGPIQGLLLTGNLTDFFGDIVVSTKWANVPVSFFFFKNLMVSNNIESLKEGMAKIVTRSIAFISVNLFLGLLGFGMAFYNHGFNNALGTRGFIYAGNELTILVLALGFILASYTFIHKEYTKYFMCFFLFFLFSFLLTSKTVLGGVFIVFMIPVTARLFSKVSIKFFKRVFAATVFLLPIVVVLAAIGINKSGVIEKFQASLVRNDNDLLTVILSNRNNFIVNGWEVFWNDFSLLGKLFGYGQKFHLDLSGHLAEVDFFSLLFASGLFGLLGLFFVLFYWLVNAYYLKRNKSYVFAPSVFLLLLFLIVASNLSGHIFGSGIAGFFIGFSIALMFYKKPIENESRL